MIELEGVPPLGTGCRRIVYPHPDDSTKCIKIVTAEARSKPNRQKGFARERRYLRWYGKEGRDLSGLSRYHGEVSTSSGPGDVFDLVRDAGGSVSPTLEQALRGGLTSLAACERPLEALRKYLMGEGIVLSDLHPGNLAWQQTASGVRLIVIDGVGNNDYVKIADWWRPWARRKLARRWEPFRAALDRRFGSTESSGGALPPATDAG